MPNITDWKRFFGTFSPDVAKQVADVDIVVMVEDAAIRNEQNQEVPIYFTDIQFQPGDQLTGWVPNTQEMIKKLTFVDDENTYIASPTVWNGAPPQVRTFSERTYNVMGRGHQVLTIPNYYPENWDVEILPAGIDFTIYPKEDFDLCRISTAAGVLLENDGTRKYDEVLAQYPNSEYVQGLFNKHPLHYRYTREFWIDGRPAGTEIKIHASTKLASLGGVSIPIAGERTVDVNGFPMYVGRKRFIMAPTGSARFRVEFYKQVTETETVATTDEFGNVTNSPVTFTYLKDTGIGFYGTASFTQWTYGRSRI